MAKLKTNKAAKKRYSLTATGKIKRTKSTESIIIIAKFVEENFIQMKQKIFATYV